MITPGQVEAAAARWGLSDIADPVAERLAVYGNLLLQWNQQISLTAIRDEAALIERHLMEGVFAAAHHPAAVTSLDFGSGTGIPGIPIASCRPELRVTLAESQRKKAAFLHEAVRQLGLTAEVHAGRAESLPAGSFDAVWMRAVDRSGVMLPLAAALVSPHGSLCLLRTSGPASGLSGQWTWESVSLLESETRVLHIGRQL